MKDELIELIRECLDLEYIKIEVSKYKSDLKDFEVLFLSEEKSELYTKGYNSFDIVFWTVEKEQIEYIGFSYNQEVDKYNWIRIDYPRVFETIEEAVIELINMLFQSKLKTILKNKNIDV